MQCECNQCGLEVKSGIRFVSGHNSRINNPACNAGYKERLQDNNDPANSRLCQCLCGQPIPGKSRKGFIDGHRKNISMKLCACNCGEHIQFDKNFIRGHSNRTNHPLKGKKNFALSERNRKNSGEKHPFYGKKRPDISAKFSGENAPFYGKQHTPEAIEKNRQSHLGKKCPWASENMKRLWKERPEEMSNTTWKDTKPELTFEMLLQSVNFQYKKQYKVGKKRPDFYLPDFNLLVEIDGCWAHGCKEHRPDSQKEDKFEDKQRYYTARGFYSIRIWEHDLVI